MLPGFLDVVKITTASGRMLEEKVELTPVMVTADSVERFVEVDELRCHAVLHLSGRQLIVRVKMSSRMEHERYRQLQALEHSSMSLIQSARLNGHDPYAYLKDVLTRLPTQRASDIAELLPHRWQLV